MTDPRETVAKGQRAELCAEFMTPMLGDTKRGYLDRIAEIAATELNPRKRQEKITALAIAIKVTNNLSNGLDAFIQAGEIAQNQLVQAKKIEALGKHERRIFDIVPSR